MANTKKKIDTDNIENVEQINKVAKVTKPAPRKFAPTDPIECRSVTYGELLLPGKKSQLVYSWANYGDVTDVEFQDLQALRSMRSPYLKRPLFIIEDDELVEQWPELKQTYSEIAKVDIENLFDLPLPKFKSRIANLPNGYKNALQSIAGAKILDGSLDSISKIKALDEVLGSDLMFYIQ